LKFFCAHVIFIGLVSYQPINSQTSREMRLIESLATFENDIPGMEKTANELLNSSEPIALMHGNYAKGFTLLVNNKHEDAIEHFKLAKYIARDLGEEAFQAKAMSKILTVYYAQSDFRNLNKSIFDAFYFARQKNDSLLLATTFKYKALYHKEQQELKKAVNANIVTAQIYEHLNHPLAVNAYLNISGIYRIMRQHDFAIYWMRIAYQKAKEVDYFPVIYAARNNLGNQFQLMGHTDSALYYYNLNWMDSSILNPYQLKVLKQNMFELYVEQENLTKASEFYNQFLPDFYSSPDNARKIEGFDVLRKFYYLSGDYDAAIACMDSAIWIAKDKEILLKLPYLYLSTINTLEDMQDAERANFYYREYLYFKDSIMMSEREQEIQEALSSFTIMDLENKYAQSRNDQSSHFGANGKFNSLLVSILAFASGGVFYLLFMLKRRKSIPVSNQDHNVSIANKTPNTPQSKSEAIKQENREEEEQAIFIQINNDLSLDALNIEYIKSDGHYVEVYLLSEPKPIVVRKTMLELSKLLPTSHFIRIHRSYFVNQNNVIKIDRNHLILSNGTELPISKSYKTKLQESGHAWFNAG
jgi:tetratricopeptide (TPR) repeat protein